jgi:hypothetical protein
MPTITSVVPSSGTAGATITVNGTGFTGLTGVLLEGVSCSFVYISSIQFTFTVPVEGNGLKDLELLFGATVGGVGSFTVDPGGTPYTGAGFSNELVSFLEVIIYSHDGTQEIAQLEGAYNISFQRDLNIVGAGSFVIVKSDPKATAANLALGNLVRIRLNGATVFSFWIEEPSLVIASPAGPVGEELTIGGRGGMAYLDRACVYPNQLGNFPAATTIPYPPSGGGIAAASILVDQINKAHARGTIPLLTINFTATHDSAGVPWPEHVFEQIHVGDDLLSLSQHLATVHPIEYIFNHDTFLLQAFNPPHGVDRRFTVVWRQGHHFADNPARQSKHFSAAKSRMLVEGAALITSAVISEVVDATYEALPNVGRREGYMSYPQTTDVPTLNSIGTWALKNLEAQTNPLQVALAHGTTEGEYEPFIDYDIGDFVTVDIPGVYDMEHFRIVTITIGFKSVGVGDYSILVDLESPYIAPLLKVKQNVVNVLNTAIYNSVPPGGGGGGGTSCCGGELLMAEAENLTTSPETGTGPATVLTVPLTIDTTNTRIRVDAHVHLKASADGDITLTGPNGTARIVPFTGDGTWRTCEVEAPALAVIVPGSYSTTLAIGFTGIGGGSATWTVDYQVLVYLVTSGG